jgi:hypothetical protein
MRVGEMGQHFNTEFEQVKRSFWDLASQMQCPHHFKTATVEMDGGSFDDFSMEVITCCNEFQRRVEGALNKLVAQHSLMVVPGAITTPNPCIKYSDSNPSRNQHTGQPVKSAVADSRNCGDRDGSKIR